MKSAWPVIVAAALVLTGSSAPPAPADVPVVVELFTSEGCSSCPPADQLFSRLAKDQPMAGVHLIPLGMHVTYWDQLGWKDPASLPGATARQQRYGERWGSDRTYTPQAVVNGTEELVGSDEDGVKKAVARAAREPHATLTLTARIEGDGLVVTLRAGEIPPQAKGPVDAQFFLTEDGLSSVVKRGENGGRTLHHDAVVRLEQAGGPAPVAAPLSVTLTGLRPEWHRDRLNLVAVVYARQTGRIWGAATTALK